MLGRYVVAGGCFPSAENPRARMELPVGAICRIVAGYALHRQPPRFNVLHRIVLRPHSSLSSLGPMALKAARDFATADPRSHRLRTSSRDCLSNSRLARAAAGWRMSPYGTGIEAPRAAPRAAANRCRCGRLRGVDEDSLGSRTLRSAGCDPRVERACWETAA
jgi:hypothetical protein